MTATTAAPPPLTDALPAAPSVSPAARVWSALAALVAFQVVYAIFLLAYFAPAICQPDDNGYFAQASLLVREHTTWFTSESPAQYNGSIHWLVTEDGKFVSRYPAGLSVIIGALYAAFGWQAGVLANPILALGCTAALFLFVRRLTASIPVALTAAAVLGFNPTFLRHALSGDSHTGVACFTAWAMYLLWCWHEKRSLWLAVLAGACLGAIPTIRYPDVVMYAGFGAFVVWSAWKSPRAWAQVAVMAVAANVVLFPQLYRNHTALGAFYRTGYALTNEQTGFGWQYFQNNFALYLRLLPSSGVGPFFALGMLGIATLLFVKPLRGLGLLCVGITLPMLLLYMAYYWAGAGPGGGAGNGGPLAGAGIMRFLVPTFVAYVAAGAYVLHLVSQKLPSTAARIAVPAVLVVVHFVWAMPDTLPNLARTQWQRENLARVTTEIEKVAEPGSVIVAENGLQQHLDYVRQWKLADPTAFRGGGMMNLARAGRGEDEPSPMQAARQRTLNSRYTGTFEERRTKFEDDVRTWAGDKKVYVVGSESELRNLARIANATTPDAPLKIVARVSLRTQPPGGNENARGGPGGGGPGGGPGGGQMGGPGGGFGGGPGGGPGGGQGGGPPPDGGPPGQGQGPGQGPGQGGGNFGFRNNRGGPGGGGGGGGGGGMMNAGTFNNASEVLIAEWTRKSPPTTAPSKP